MSFILDALKKSELERQRQAIPGLMDVGVPVVRARLPLWALMLGILLSINVIILAVFLFRHEREAAATPAPAAGASTTAAGASATAAGASTAAAGASATAAGASTTAVGASATAGSPGGSIPPTAQQAENDHFSPMDSVPTYAPEIPIAQNVAPVRRPAGVHGAGMAENPRAPNGRDPVLRDRDATAEDARSDSDEVLPSIAEIDGTASQGLPELHLDVHVFAANPADRFVYVNNRKYREGATLEEGPLVERIRRDGVVLNYQGLRFLLPRQQ